MDLKKLLGRVDYYDALLTDLEEIEKKYTSNSLAMMNWSSVYLPFSELKRELEFERDRALFASQIHSEYQKMFSGSLYTKRGKPRKPDVLFGDENK